MSEKVTGKAFDLNIFGRLMSFAKIYRWEFIISTLAAILLSLVSVAKPILLQEIVNTYFENKDKEGILFFSLLMVAFLVAEVLLQFLFIYKVNWLGQHIIMDIRVKLQKHMLQFKMAYFDKSSVGKLVTRLVSDTETIAQFFGQGLFMIISDLLKMLVVAIVMLFMNWKLALIAFIILPIMIYATKLFQIAIKSAFQEVRTQVANLNGFVQERVTGMNIVQLFNREKLEYENFVKINEKHKKAHVRTVWYYSIFFPIAEILTSIAVGLMVWFGGLDIVDSGITNAGEIIAFIMMSQMLFRPLRQIADKFNTLQMGMVAGDRVFEVLDTKSQIDKTGNVEATNFRGDIAFKNVRFSYIKGEEVLKGISFNVKAGETVAIVGATGAGKSTIINLVNRFYEINEGEICIDNHNIKQYTLQSLRNQIAVVLQDVFLFSDTIFNNIVLNKEGITLDDVKNAAKEIGIHEFIMSLPGDYNYNVKERGAMLSSGQRQLIAFLRAYVSDPSVLILDEATSSIDSYSEKLIQEATDKITKHQTSIIIAHRLTTIKNADRIIVMDKGEIVEQGSHLELLEKDGYYKNLYDMQFASEVA
ncbi:MULTISPECIES: ABC transporter ATP-binding protein [Flavobacteriaceae]|uniref:ABC transporter ATP-binding protein n=2 Tax=Flavobacteriaceae TaxID=49546 RepID=A0A4Y8AUN8_9FLAO|nr:MULTISPECIES: ABC transporter ATP-binding protein [Flavobacteriaceae]TEW75193.1 ABC transporter ATP-binding protein [Gramella jeungdoensis]GGK40776.1 xenobiotic ABC transporter ATP-binding protein [Lutibacter litoralis]